MKSLNIKYLPAIDHLRAYAACLILVYHSSQLISNKLLFGDKVPPDFWIYTNNPLYAVIIEGHTAVSLFMVLSGFIFTYGAMGCAVKYGAFIKNRFLRIYPLFLFLTFFGIHTFSNNFSFSSLIQTLFFFSNVNGELEVRPFSSMFWAISVEFQFYLVFPFLICIFQKEGNKTFYRLILLMIVFRIIAVLLGANARDLSYWTIVGRFDQFLIGMIAARIFLNVAIENRKLWFSMLLLSFVVVVMVLFIFNKLGGWPNQSIWKVFWPSIEATCWSFFLITYLKVFNNNNNKFQKLLSKIGEMSFSIYLLHFIVLTIIVNKVWFIDFPVSSLKSAVFNTLIIVLPITLILSYVTYTTIERPFLNLRRKYLTDKNLPSR